MALRNFELTSIIVLSSAALAFGVLPGCGDDDVEIIDDEDAGAGGAADGGSGGTGGSGGRGGSGGTAGSGGDGIDGGAGMDGGPEAGMDAADAGTLARLRLVHAAPGATNVDVYVAGDSTPIIGDLAYGEATDYLELAAGEYELEVRAAGDSATMTPLYTTEVEVEAGGSYTAVAAGNIESTDDEDEFRVLAFEENFGADTDDRARVRVVHAGFDAPAVGLDVDNDDASDPEVDDLERFADTEAAGIELAAQTRVQLGIVAGGETMTAFTMPELAEGQDAFVIATGTLDRLPREETAFSLLVVLPDSSTVWVKPNPVVYALHVSPDAGPVDVFLGDIEVIDSADFGDLVRLQVLPDVVFTVDFFAGEAGESERPAMDPVVSGDTPAFEAGGQYLIVAAGEIGEDTFELIDATEAFPLGDATTRIRAIHASADAPTVDVGTVTTGGTLDTPPLFADLSFLEVSDAEGLAVDPGTYTIGLAQTTETETAVEFDVAVTEGQRAFVVAGGDFTGGTNPLQLFVVNTAQSPWAVTAVPQN